MKHKYMICGWVTTELQVEIGTFETCLSLHDSWDLIYQIFGDDSCYQDGIIARRIK